MNKKYLVILALVLSGIVVWLVLSPPRFWVNMTKQVEPTAEVGAQLVEKYGCRNCHRIGGYGGLAAPNLDSVITFQKESDPALVSVRLWLRNPKAIRPNTAMPNFHLSDTEIEAIVQYLIEASETAANE